MYGTTSEKMGYRKLLLGTVPEVPKMFPTERAVSRLEVDIIPSQGHEFAGYYRSAANVEPNSH